MLFCITVLQKSLTILRLIKYDSEVIFIFGKKKFFLDVIKHVICQIVTKFRHFRWLKRRCNQFYTSTTRFFLLISNWRRYQRWKTFFLNFYSLFYLTFSLFYVLLTLASRTNSCQGFSFRPKPIQLVTMRRFLTH